MLINNRIIVFWRKLGYYFSGVIELKMPKLANRNHNWLVITFAFIILFIFLAWCMPIGSVDAKIESLAAFCGSAISILFAYYNTRYQIELQKKSDDEKKEQSLLPYFNIDSLGLIDHSFNPEQCDLQGFCFSETKWSLQLEYATISSTPVPIQNVDVSLYTKVMGKVSQKSLGHIQSEIKTAVFFSRQTYERDYIKFCKSNPSGLWIDDVKNKLRIDIKCKTVLGNDVFFTYGNDVNATAYYKRGEQWILYDGMETDISKARLEQNM